MTASTDCGSKRKQRVSLRYGVPCNLRFCAAPKPPLCKGRWHGASRDGGIAMQLRALRTPHNEVGMSFGGVCVYIDAAVKQSLYCVWASVRLASSPTAAASLACARQLPLHKGALGAVKIVCHCEPVRTLAWQSVPLFTVFSLLFSRKNLR